VKGAGATALLTALLALLLLALPREGWAQGPITVRVLTYNIRHGEGLDRVYDLARLADIMKGAAPDLIALQEVDDGTQRSGGTNQIEVLAEMLGMHGEFGRAIDFQGGGYGVAILSRWPLHYADNQPLPSSPPYYEPRTALTVFTRVGEHGPLVQLTTTHLDDARDSPDRVEQVKRLNDLLVSGDGRPSILAGDFNARGDTDLLAILGAHWTNITTSIIPDGFGGGNRRGLRSDYIFFRPASRWRVVDWQVIDAPPQASDHRPVLAVLELSPES
jgi:endonuclease/exonuclease/phosphatase family metal-dependent hydrolase